MKLNYVSNDVKPWLNDFWFSISGAFPGGWNVQTAALAIENHFKTNMLAALSDQISFRGTDLLVNNAGVVATGTTYTTQNGSLSSGLAPTEVAAIVRMQSAAAGRRGHGRIFLSGLDAGTFEGGRIAPASLGLFNTIATTMQTNITDQGVTYHPAVYSRKDNILYNIQYCLAEVPLGTQRRRRVRR